MLILSYSSLELLFHLPTNRLTSILTSLASHWTSFPSHLHIHDLTHLSPHHTLIIISFSYSLHHSYRTNANEKRYQNLSKIWETLLHSLIMKTQLIPYHLLQILPPVPWLVGREPFLMRAYNAPCMFAILTVDFIPSTHAISRRTDKGNEPLRFTKQFN